MYCICKAVHTFPLFILSVSTKAIIFTNNAIHSIMVRINVKSIKQLVVKLTPPLLPIKINLNIFRLNVSLLSASKETPIGMLIILIVSWFLNLMIFNIPSAIGSCFILNLSFDGVFLTPKFDTVFSI